MFEPLKTLFENNVISEDIKNEIENAWQEKVNESRKQITVQLREEFAKKYEHDKEIMVESIDQLLEQRLKKEIKEFTEDRKQLHEAKVRYARSIKEHSNLMKDFVTEALAKEIAELHEDQIQVAEKFQTLEKFVVNALSKEITEFYEDQKNLAETKVKLVREAKTKFNEIKKKFIESSSAKVAKLVEKSLKNEINQLKEDIERSRKNDFGRRLFEAFSAEYMNSYVRDNSEAAQLAKIIKKKNNKLAEAKKVIAQTKKLAESQRLENSKLMESVKREKVLSDLTTPLSKKHRDIMLDLLESVQTDKLNHYFDKYLPSVLHEDTKKTTQILKENREITGDKLTKNKADDSNVLELRRLAGLN